MRSLLGWSSCGLVPRPLQEVHPPPAADRGADRRRPRVCPPQKRKGPSRDKAPAAAARGANVAGSPATTGHPRVYPPSPTLPRTGQARTNDGGGVRVSSVGERQSPLKKDSYSDVGQVPPPSSEPRKASRAAGGLSVVPVLASTHQSRIAVHPTLSDTLDCGREGSHAVHRNPPPPPLPSLCAQAVPTTR